MKVEIKVSEIEDSIELMELLKQAQKLRQSIYTNPTRDITMKINVNIEV